jgi:hypothetical protein
MTMRTATRENLLRASELSEGLSDVLAAASLSEDSEASRRLLRMSDNALAVAKALEKIGKAKTPYQPDPITVTIAEPQIQQQATQELSAPREIMQL